MELRQRRRSNRKPKMTPNEKKKLEALTAALNMTNLELVEALWSMHTACESHGIKTATVIRAAAAMIERHRSTETRFRISTSDGRLLHAFDDVTGITHAKFAVLLTESECSLLDLQFSKTAIGRTIRQQLE